MVKKSEIIDGVEILFENSKKAKNLSISVRPNRGVRVAIPLNVPLKTALAFAEFKIDWIKKHTEKIEKLENQHIDSGILKTAADRKRAKNKLVNRLSYLAEKHGFLYNRVFIKNQKTRWGSCSCKNNINLNINLVRLPDELIDYVLMHELVHTRVKNHSREFWDELDRYMGSSKRIDARMKQYNLSLYR